jgi:hypothetical protein
MSNVPQDGPFVFAQAMGIRVYWRSFAVQSFGLEPLAARR